jgi:hypothetical protein
MASLRKHLTLPEVKAAMVESLKESGLTTQQMPCTPITHEQCSFSKYPAGGFVIPYSDINGKPTKFFRFRYVEQPSGVFSKPPRYVQPKGVKPEPYFSTSVPWSKVAAAIEEPIFITEGEKKAEKACRERFATIGLGGVFSFESKDETFIEALEAITWKDRRVYIVFDSDIHTNRNVVIAANRLARQLLRRGAIVLIIRLYSPDGEKFALDDLLTQQGREAFQHYIDEEAEEFTDSRELHRLNEHVIYVHNHSIFEFNTGQRIRPNDFKNSVYSDWQYDVKQRDGDGDVTKTKTFKTAAKWLEWPGRAKAPAYVYEPGRELILPEGVNDWKGWGSEPRKYKKEELEYWHTMMLWLFGPENRKWAEQWFAYPLQHPGEKLTTAILNWGRHHGTGKDMSAAAIGRIYGSNWIKLKERDIDSTHNTLFEHKQFVTFEELSGGQTNRRVVGDVFKTLITQSHININPKFLPPYKIRDCVNYYVTSNHSDPLHLEPEDRRWFVNEVANRPKERAFYIEFHRQYVQPGDNSGALFQYLLDLDLDGFEPKGHAPVTQAKRNLIALSKSDPAEWASRLRDDPDSVLVYNGTPLPFSLMTEAELLSVFALKFGKEGKRSFLQRVLAEAGITKANKGYQVRNCGDWGDPHLYIVRDRENLEQAKEKALAERFVKEHRTAPQPFNSLGRKF